LTIGTPLVHCWYSLGRPVTKGAGTNMKVVGHVSIRRIRREAPEKFFYRAPPLFIQCPPKWRGTAQCNVLSLQPSTVHRPRGYKVCKLSHCDELIYVIYKLCKAQRQTTRHHWTLNFTCHLFTIFHGKNEIKLLKFVTSF